MDNIKQWTITVSAVSILSGILLSVLPESSHRKLYKVMVVVILIYGVFQPFSTAERVCFDIGDYLSENYRVSENTDKYAINAMRSSAEKAIESLLAQETENSGIKCTFSCECEVSDTEIKVVKITVATDAEEDEKNTITDIASSLGFERNVIAFVGEEDEYR